MSKTHETTGGPAFPALCQYGTDGEPTGAQVGSTTGWETGMTLRDYFAMRILPGLMQRSCEDGYTDESAINQAYYLADVALRRRRA